MFYKNGLSFTCQRCLYCCSVDPGFVFLSEKDLEKCASETGLNRDEFIKVYCRYIDYGEYYMISLKEKQNYDCIFLTSAGCSIYNARPTQCRTYPFWKNIVDSSKSWKEESLSCPGINKGRCLKREEIETSLRENEENTPLIIPKKR